MQNILQKVYNSIELNELESYTLFKSIILKKISDIELSAVLIALKTKGETTNEILGAVKAHLEYIKFFPRPNYIFADIVGTGGDNSNSINISTTSALVASTCNLKIIKHCNKKISSKCGSVDILKKFGINIQYDAYKSREILDQLNICFLFSQKYHDSFVNSMFVRKLLKTKTIFNIIGPLLNPAMPKHIVIGVSDPKIMFLIAEILKKLNYHHAIILHSNNTDEITLHSTTKIIELKNKKITSYILDPHDFGVNYYNKSEIQGGTSKENYEIIKYVLKGKGPKSITETIAVNVAVLLLIFGYSNLQENTKNVLDIIQNGKVYEKIIKLSQV